jgi:hypothetical protein
VRLPVLVGLAGAAVLAVLASGCGGGSGPSESQIRERLEAGVAKVGAAPSLEATADYELERGDGSGREPVECLVARVERGPPTKLDLAAFDGGCEGGDEGHEVIAIRNRAWTAIGSGEFAPATVDPSVPTGFVNEEARFKRLLAAAEGFEEADAEGSFVEPDGESVKGPKYRFTAPASSLYDGAEASETGEFEAVLDQDGYLRELHAIVAGKGAKAIVTQRYSGIGQPQRISPPPREQVSGPVTRIENRKEFEAMLGPASTVASNDAAAG